MKLLTSLLISILWTGIMTIGAVTVCAYKAWEWLTGASKAWTNRRLTNQAYEQAQIPQWADIAQRRPWHLIWTDTQRCADLQDLGGPGMSGFDWGLGLGPGIHLDPYEYESTQKGTENSSGMGNVVSLSWYRSAKCLKEHE